MLKKISKFKDLSKSQKIHIIVFLLFISFMPIKTFLEWRGRDFPQDSELNYSTGTLEYSRAPGKDSKSFTILRSTEQVGEEIVYGCSYTAFVSSTTGSCMGLKRIEPYLGKTATVGWYDQPSFLGFENNVPQLVSLEVDGKYIKTYEEVFQANRRSHVVLGLICLFYTIFSIFLFIFIVYPKDIIYQEK